MNEEEKAFIGWVKDHFFDTLPLTLMGVILILLPIYFISGITGLGVYADMVKTGFYVLSLGVCYVLGKASHLLINSLLSRFTSERRTPE